MDLATFRATLSADEPPDGIDAALEALWWDARGDWDRAHDCAQSEDNSRANWTHAYLHRKEGDPANASYWYRRAGRPPAAGSLDQEWTFMAEVLLRDA